MKNPKARILVIGGAGYIGSHVVRKLIDAHHEVVILDDLSTGHRRLIQGETFVQGRLGDVGLLTHLFEDHSIDAVMHFAAFSQVGESMNQPLRYYHNNLAETIALLETMIKHGINRFVFSSTAAVYGEPRDIPITESHPCLPTNPYGNTKLAVERLLADCDAAYGLKFMALRYFNAAGADESAQIGELHEPETHLIPNLFKAARGQIEHIQLFGTDYPTRDGTCIRDYVHVNDLARAHLLALDVLLADGKSAVYNLGSNNGFSVKEVIDQAEVIIGKKIPVVDAPRRPGDPAILIASSEKIKQELGWNPDYESLDKIIHTAWQWHLKSE